MPHRPWKVTESRNRRNMAKLRLRQIRRSERAGPQFLLELVEEIDARLRSRGGRPTDFDWEIRRLIPLRRRDWESLTRLGHEVGVGAAHLAALLIEKGVQRMEREPRFGAVRPTGH
jgi:hypothetical protein